MIRGRPIIRAGRDGLARLYHAEHLPTITEVRLTAIIANGGARVTSDLSEKGYAVWRARV